MKEERQQSSKKSKKLRNPLVHEANLIQKEADKKKYGNPQSKEYISQIRLRYKEWHDANIALIGPGASSQSQEQEQEIIYRRVELFEAYKSFLDQQHYAEHFDSRSNLHSTALEEFLYYLFKDLVSEFGKNTLIGKSHTFKDIFFVAPCYSKMLERPYARIETKDHDFVIGVTVEASFRASTPLELNKDKGSESVLITEEPTDYDQVTVTNDAETHLFDIPVVAIECKTYLDKNMLEGLSRAAEELKARNPNGLYIVVMEWIKLSEAVNIRKYKVDQIYILRKQKNTDREYRFLESYNKNPIDSEVVWHLFSTVRHHLTTDWTGGVEHGVRRGWLID
jgi:hypothetical protein